MSRSRWLRSPFRESVRRYPAVDWGIAAAARYIDCVRRSVVTRSTKTTGDVRLDDGKFGIPRRATASRPTRKRIYKLQQDLNDIPVLSKSCYGPSVSRVGQSSGECRVHSLPQRRRARRAGRKSRSRHRRQLCRPQPNVLKWLADHPRWTFHFTPTSASWLNAVEGFFSAITRRQIRLGAFHSVDDLRTRWHATSTPTTAIVGPSHGPLPPKRSSKNSLRSLYLLSESVH
jgi:hypothetical protein